MQRRVSVPWGGAGQRGPGLVAVLLLALLAAHTIQFGPAVPDAEAPAPLTESAGRENVFYGVAVKLDTGTIRAKQRATLRYTLSADGQPVRDLAPYDGAGGHLFIISAD